MRFFEDLEALRVERPETIARATEHIPQIGGADREDCRGGSGLQMEDGSWYFRLAAFPEYWKIKQKRLSGMEDRRARGCGRVREGLGAGLWRCGRRPNPANLLGYGDWARPAGLAHRVLGHGDGVPGRELRTALRRRRPDVPHHENEIAQSETATHKPFARHWMHVRFLLVDGRKDVEERGEFLYVARSAAQRVQGLGDPPGADFRALPAAAQLYLRTGLADATNAIGPAAHLPGG